MRRVAGRCRRATEEYRRGFRFVWPSTRAGRRPRPPVANDRLRHRLIGYAPRQQDGFQPDEELKDEDYFDIGSGSYDVEVKPGPQAGSRREEDLKMMGEFVAKLPPDYMMNFMDLLFELVDAPAGRKLSERANKLLPEGLRDEGEQGQQDPAQLQAKLQEVGEKFEKLQQEHQQAQQAIETKQVEAQAKAQLQQADLESKEGIAQAKLVVEWTKVMAQSDNEEAKNKAKAKVDRIFAERKRQGDSNHGNSQQHNPHREVGRPEHPHEAHQRHGASQERLGPDRHGDHPGQPCRHGHQDPGDPARVRRHAGRGARQRLPGLDRQAGLLAATGTVRVCRRVEADRDAAASPAWQVPRADTLAAAQRPLGLGPIEITRQAGTAAAVILNAAPVQGSLVDQAQAAIAGYEVEMVPIVLHHRIAHVHAFTDGLAAPELTRDSQAGTELTAVFRWVQKKERSRHG